MSSVIKDGETVAGFQRCMLRNLTVQTERIPNLYLLTFWRLHLASKYIPGDTIYLMNHNTLGVDHLHALL